MAKRLPYLMALLCLAVPLRGSTPMGAAVRNWRYDPVAKVVRLTVVNTSQKEITGYSLSIRTTHPDTTVNLSERLQDLLPLMITVDRIGSDVRREYGNGTFAPGASREEQITDPVGVVDVSAVVDVVSYADGTADVQNERAFKRLIAQRKGAILAKQKASEVLKHALEEQTVKHPSAASIAELKRLADVLHGKNLAPDDPEAYEGFYLNEIRSQFENQPIEASSSEGEMIERFINDQERAIEFSEPHTLLRRTGGTR